MHCINAYIRIVLFVLYSGGIHMGVRPAIAVLALLLSSSGVMADQTYDDVIKGKSCKESGSQRLDCTYRVGRDLYIAIAGIGMPDTGINFYASSLKGDYYASVGVLHGCIIVTPGKSSGSSEDEGYAFISPKNGKVYKNWRSCRKGY